MILKKISLLNFKNISRAELEFAEGINCLVGDNGAGKTNVVDAVYYLSMCKSALSMTDGQSIRHGEEFFVVEGEYLSDAGRREGVSCTFARQGGRSNKSVKRNGKEYERLADHIGLIPIVIVSPMDSFLVSDAADERRRYLNGFISQFDAEYLSAVMRYNQVLGQRNRLLKQPFSPAGEELLGVLDEQLVRHGLAVHAGRARLVERLQPLVAEYYRVLSDDREQVEISYRSELDSADFAELLLRSRGRDIANGFTTTGIHRDDLVMRIGGWPLRKYGSQGQQKSLLVALKLAQYTLVCETLGEKPILLLDDLFDKLDMKRVEKLISLVDGERFGQIFITDCNKVRLQRILDGGGRTYSLMYVADGAVCPNPESDTLDPL